MVFSGLIVLAMLLGPPVFGVNPAYVDPARMSANALGFTTEDMLPVLITIFEAMLILHLIVKVPIDIFKTMKLIRVPKPYALSSTNNNQS